MYKINKMRSYLIESRDRIFVNKYGFLSFAKKIWVKIWVVNTVKLFWWC